MPRRNVSDRTKLGPHHVYNRARSGRAAFRDDEDRGIFLDLLADRLGVNGSLSGMQVCAVCLMNSHFHLIVWQHEPEAMRRLMQSITTSYVRLYNRKYGTDGPLFAGPFRSRALEGGKDIRWTIAYVHANHPTGPTYRYSTHNAYLDDHKRPGWLALDRGLAAFGDKRGYELFMRDHATRAALNDRFF
jgi:REP element-mobilizing transposase RayT